MESQSQNEVNEQLDTVSVSTMWFLQLWYSDDIQIRICRYLIYSIIVLLALIHVAWRWYGPEISNMYTKQGFSSPASPEKDRSSTRCEDVQSDASSDKKTD
ncbi:T-cell leukemia translocation-altered gene protein homolog [Anneissia japonica]|uniref:T-cell leukemia translocation-altered gene protein homolog n=1 Tax=Anneissia japonica TaxID=1529436 RepID=UPI001425749A|nr:T-cell leukemia translocation-altered gene protein homolog [Anneissia japonica]XP_033114568.1 T-cell leukemia translocation-altered gene protein homolog [Anneissia japonica]